MIRINAKDVLFTRIHVKVPPELEQFPATVFYPERS